MRIKFYFVIITILSFVIGCEEIPRERFFNEEPDPDPDPVLTVSGDVLRVPSHYPNLKIALSNALEGDTILIADGNYSGDGFRDLVIQGRSVVVKSENGPQETVLNLSGSSLNNHFGFIISSQSASNTIIDGITIRSGYINLGAAIFCSSSSPTFKNCIFRNNTATTAGGAIRCKASSPTIINCTIVSNSSLSGAGLMLLANSKPIIRNTIIAFSGEGEAIRCNDRDSYPTISCSNIFDNRGGDWINCIDTMITVESGNMSVDPLFSNLDSGDLYLLPNSPCLPENNNCDRLIGALGANQ
jgi:predicted outer membrane repeat protein